jgi:hypothetical protein
MKIAFFSESTADESALRILIEALLESEIEETNLPNKLRYRSSSHLDKNLPSVIAGVYYNSDAEALVVASDSDDTPVHISEHDEQENENCRLCNLRKTVEKELAGLSEVAGREVLKVAIGVPVPAIEAWYLYGKNPHVSEFMWIRKQTGESITYDRKKLKKEVYGSTRYSLQSETAKAVEETTRIVENGLLEGLERIFPAGFGSLADETRKWKGQ